MRTPAELERRIRQRGLPDVEAEVERGRELVRLLDQVGVHGKLGHVVETTHQSAVVVAETIWQHVQHVTSEGSGVFETHNKFDAGGDGNRLVVQGVRGSPPNPYEAPGGQETILSAKTPTALAQGGTTAYGDTYFMMQPRL